jgi:hypothetical protein
LAWREAISSLALARRSSEPLMMEVEEGREEGVEAVLEPVVVEREAPALLEEVLGVDGPLEVEVEEEEGRAPPVMTDPVGRGPWGCPPREMGALRLTPPPLEAEEEEGGREEAKEEELGWKEEVGELCEGRVVSAWWNWVEVFPGEEGERPLTWELGWRSETKRGRSEIASARRVGRVREGRR